MGKRENLSCRNFQGRIARACLRLVLSALLILTMGVNAFAVTGSTVAADGVYSSSITAYKYKYGKLDKTYTGVLNVAVSNGEIAGLWISNASSDKMSKLITNEIYYTYVGTEASQTAVGSASGADAVSGASVSGSATAVNSSVKKQYIADIQGAIQTALSKAAARTSTTSTTETAAKTVQGTASVSDAEGSKIVLDVGLDSNGKIVNLSANSASVSDWSSILSKVSSEYVGKTADQIDTVSGATPYATAVNTAVIAAMSKAGSGTNTEESNQNNGSDASGSAGASDSGKTIKPDESAAIAVGETVTLDGTHNSMASGESWSSSDTSVATVAAPETNYDSDATVTGISAGTVTITHTINTLFGSSTETFTVTVTASGSGSSTGGGSGSGSGASETAGGVTAIQVTKEWKNDSAADRPASVTVGIYNGSTKVQTLTLNPANNWTATATGLSTSVTYTVQEDAVEGYSAAITKSEDTGSQESSGWTAQSYGAVEAGKTYAFTYTSNGTTYLLGRSGTSVIGTTSGLTGGVPNANIGNDYKWEVTKAASGTRYGEWLAKNLGNNYYLAPYNGSTTGYSNSAVLQQSNSYYGNVNLHFDDDGSIWNGYGSLNLYAVGTTVRSDPSSYTVFTPYLYSDSASAAKTASYTITNTKDDSGSGGTGTGGGGQGGDDEEPDDPAHVKAIDPENEIAEEYTITLNVTGQSKTTTSTNQTGETTTSPYDILLVLDNTMSMTASYGNTTRLAAMKSAAQSFVNGLPSADGSKIAMVSFTTGNYNSIVTTDVSWADLSSGRSTVSSKISALNAPDTGYDTYFTQPLGRASSLLDSVASDENKKFVVFFTDGAAAESVSTIQSLAAAVKGKADATFSIGIVSGSTETQKAQALASESGNYYDVTTAGTMGTAFASALTTIQSQTTVTKVPMTNVVIADTLSNYVELSSPDASNSGVTLSNSPADNNVTIGNVTVDGKEVKITLSGDLTDDTVYTVSIPVKPSDAAQKEANENDDAVSSFVSNSGAELTYQYGTEAAKTVDYTETPKIFVAKEVTLTYDANAEEVSGMPNPAEEKKALDADSEKASFDITEAIPTRDGYTFKGWNTDKEASDAILEAGDEDYEIDSDTILYAIWELDKVTLTYEANAGGDEVFGMPDPTSVEVNKGSEVTISDAVPTRDGYTFLGWADSAEETIAEYEAGDDLEVHDNKTIYAVWRQDYRLIFEDYTKGGVNISGVGIEALEGYDNCMIGTTYVNGDVTFTLSADMAVVAAVHSDGSMQTLMDQNGSYNRLYCTADRVFTVNVSSGDVYVVLAYKGDVNLDGSVGLMDANLADRIFVKTYSTATKLQELISDVNADNSVGLMDSNMIDRSFVKLYTLPWDIH